MSYIQFAELVDSSGNPSGTAANPLITQPSSKIPQAIQSITDTETAAGNHVVIAGVAGKRIKVFALSAFAPSATTAVTATFTDGIAGATLFTVLAEAPAQAVFAFGIAVSLPSFLFATSPGNGLIMNLSASDQVTANASYWIE